MAVADISRPPSESPPPRSLADIALEVRDEARRTRGDSGNRSTWEAALLAYGMKRLGETSLTGAAARAWCKKLAHDIAADLVKPAGASPRAASDQMVVWQDMPPVPGWHDLRVYARQQRGVYLRYQLVTRVLAALDVAYGDDPTAILAYQTLGDACLAAGVDAQDIEALAS